MTTSGITNSSLVDMTNLQSNKSEAKNSKSSGFDSIINMSINNKASQHSSNDKTSNDMTKSFENNEKVNSNKKNIDSDKKTKSKKDEKTVNESKNNTTKKTSQKENVSDDNAVVENNQMAQEIRDKIKEVLDIDDDKLNEVMQQLGIVDITALDNQGLMEVVSVVNGCDDVSVLLTDESVLNSYDMLCDSLVAIEENYVVKEGSIDNQQLEDVQILDDNFAKEVLNEDTQYVKVDKEDSTDAKEDKSISNDIDENDIKNHTSEKEEKITVINDKESKQSFEQDSTAKDNNEIYNDFIENLNVSVNQINVENQEFVDGVNQTVQMRDIVNQIVEKIKIEISSESTSMELALNPENLGKLNLSVTSKNGVMTAQFIVENETAKQAIESQLEILRENLENQGVKVEAVEVTISNMTDFTRDESNNSNQYSDSSSQKKKSRNINIASINEEQDLTQEEKLIADMMERDGTSINYSA